MLSWGIIGPGRIAHQFARSVNSLDSQRIHAVASRSLQRARDFAEQYCAQETYDCYDDLAACKDIDAVYVATTNPYHYDAVMTCLEAGKAVLCEKPLSLNADFVRRMINKAAEKKVFFMEAMWTRFLPAVVQANLWLNDGMIGEPRMLRADFTRTLDSDPKDRWFNIDQGGGALLDLGIYPVAFSSMIFGPEYSELHSTGYLGGTGVDEQTAIIMKYRQGQIAQLSCSIAVQGPCKACITGTDGYIELDNFWMADNAKLIRNDGTVYSCSFDYNGTGYKYEAMEVQRCLEEGRLQSEIMPWNESVKLMEILDRVKANMGLKYPQE